MSKFYGVVGYIESVEIRPGVWKEQVTERNYYGEVIRNTRRLQSTENLNDDINISNEISIVADPYALNHFHSIRYVQLMGAKWKATNVEVQPPRLLISLGGVYNG